MKLRALKCFGTKLGGYQAGMTYDLPINPQVRRWISDGLFEVIEQDQAELAAFEAGKPKKRGRPRKTPEPV